MKTYTLYLYRHGLTSANYDGTYCGHRDIPLSARGRESLNFLKENCTYPDVPVVFTSPLQRCRQSAKIMFPENDAIEMRELIEYDFGEFDGCTAEDLKDKLEFATWLSGGPNVAPPYGETNADFGDRIADAFIKIVEGMMKTGITETAVVTHGGVVSALMSMFAIPEAPMTEWPVDPGCGYELRITPTLWTHGQKCEATRQVPFVTDEFIDEYDLEEYVMTEEELEAYKQGFFEG
ncbi:MAG: histidine phosphatase family protein [Clostridia bacterium]|nr:histidine phosphatase family protein [Clostridia bacterium]